MNSETCFNVLKNITRKNPEDAASEGWFTDEELRDIIKESEKFDQKIIDSGASYERTAMNIAMQQSQNTRMNAAIKYRNVILQHAAKAKMWKMISDNWKGKELEGLMAMLGGVARSETGARLSVDAMQTAMEGRNLSALQFDLQNLDKDGFCFDAFRKHTMDLEIARALWSIDNPNPAAAFKGDKRAMDIAQVIHKHQERIREQANRAGGYIGKTPGYICKQTHDAYRITAATFDQWSKDISPLLDWDKIQGGALTTKQLQDDFLKAVYENITTGKRIAGTGTKNPFTGDLPGTIIGSEASRVSRERVMEFKDADSWYKYNQDYGYSTLSDTVIDGVRSLSRSTAFMQACGPSPENNIRLLMKEIHDSLHGDVEATRKFNNGRKKVDNLLKEITGEVNIPSNIGAARLARIARQWIDMAKLGGAVITSFSDVPVASSELAFQGKSFFGSMVKLIGDVVSHGKSDLERQRLLGSMGIFSDAMGASLSTRFSEMGGVPGKITKMHQLFFRMNGLQWWTDAWRQSVGITMGYDLAAEISHAASQFSKLTPKRQRVLSLFDIGQNELDAISHGTMEKYDGKDILTPAIVDSLSEDTLKQYGESFGRMFPTQKKGAKPDPFLADKQAAYIDRERETLRNKLGSYYRDRICTAVLEPDARTRALVHQGLEVGSFWGEIDRFVAQFRSFPVAYIQKVMGRDLRSGEGKWDVAVNMGKLIMMTSLFGFGATVISDTLKGKTLPDPDTDEAKNWLKLVLRGVTKGGGLSILGDLFLNEYSRSNSMLDVLGGPGGAVLNDVANIFSKGVLEGDPEKAGAMAVQSLIRNTPYLNLFYIRGTLDYLVLYSLQELINPGYMARLNANAMASGQTYLAADHPLF